MNSSDILSSGSLSAEYWNSVAELFSMAFGSVKDIVNPALGSIGDAFTS